MGVDVVMYVKTKSGNEPVLEWDLPSGFEFRSPNNYAPEDATHEVHTMYRYYGDGYERGPWHEIAGVLMLLFACEDVEKVWYDGDCSNEFDQISPDKVLEITKYFMKNGNRPYRGSFK